MWEIVKVLLQNYCVNYGYVMLNDHFKSNDGVMDIYFSAFTIIHNLGEFYLI